MKTLMGNIDSVQDELGMKFSLVKGELEKEISLRKDIVKLQKENILKHLVSKTVENVHEEELLKDKKKRDRMLHVSTISLNLKKRNNQEMNVDVSPIMQQQEAPTKADFDMSRQLLESVKAQQNSINNIMGALKGLASFKNNVQQEISSIANQISDLKGKEVSIS